ncbi:DNA-binding transcriptional LysR family regulator [Sphingomonas vulcanisoli]|uniref:DNA-binding transcriptional LysR family regulator n=1 Tax=Sphingomonas vulcanisoli TaxID=1658060 RepID=A0ABX0TT81_9SPHN|nr:LysR family transcriptional regulator [Sphingomonas vulcanisoli]NIJ08723.1 DNA-binding transcriptional LysR family regulator [Sphingomonas vulcanisoli]
MIQLGDLRVFLEINATGSFSEAARRLRMPKSSVARQIDRLERTLGGALFARTSRTVALTDAGRAFLPHARRLYDDGVETENVLKNGNRGASGKLTVSATAPFARHFLVPHLPAFLDRHPDVQVALWLTPARVEVGSGEGQVDIAIRLRFSAGPDLANRKLGEIDFVVVASPAYLAAYGAPERPDDLKHHQLIELGPPNKAHQVELRRGKEIATIRYNPRLQIDDPDAVCLAAENGAGIAVVPRFVAAPAVAAGRLANILPDWGAAPIPVSLLYRTNIAPPGRIRAYAEFLLETVGRALG